MKTVTFNLNKNIFVKLTERGYQKLLDDYNKMRDYLGPSEFLKSLDINYFKGHADENGYTKFQAWEFMKTFGGTIDRMWNGDKYFELDIKLEISE